MARALDVVGDRWSLLIVRELLTQGDCRYTDLRRGLPGLASNLLSQRLRDLEAAAVVTRRTLPAPVGASVYALTERGRDLRGAVRELVRWGAPLMAELAPADEFRRHWLSLPLRFLCRDTRPDEATVVVRVGDETDGCDVIAADGTIEVVPVSVDRVPDATVTGPPQALVGLFAGQVPVGAAPDVGLVIGGSARALERVLAPAPVGSLR